MKECLKYDEEKLRYDLVPPYPLEQIVRVYNFGAKKYKDHNWLIGIRWSRAFAAVMRHLWAWWRGEDTDPESGLPNLAHAAWTCIALLEFSKHTRYVKFDDRVFKEIKFKLTDNEAKKILKAVMKKVKKCPSPSKKK